VLFGVRLEKEEEDLANNTFSDICTDLSNGRVKYTIMKFGRTVKEAEAKKPYRIKEGHHTIPKWASPNEPETFISTGDLFRVRR